MPSTPPVILSIAGHDPTSGAGATADIKTAAAHGCFAATCITALTVQSTAGVRRVQTVAPDFLVQTLEEVAEDLPIAAVRIGMLGNRHVGMAVAGFLERRRPPNVVMDPILASSCGAELLDQPGLDMLRKSLLPLVQVVTPNLNEAAALTGLPVTRREDLPAAAARLHELGARAVVITGGHLDPPVDFLSLPDGKAREYPSKRIECCSTHGTGCAFATALACNLALGKALEEAVGLAQQYVHGALREAYPMGRGAGPVNHLWRT
jgi:hydroxymethylpyrimidine/phosphomethylpyrimidine kinase